MMAGASLGEDTQYIATEEDGLVYLGSTSIHSFYTKSMLPWLVFEVLGHKERMLVSVSKNNTELTITTKNKQNTMLKVPMRTKKRLESCDSNSNSSFGSEVSGDLMTFDDTSDGTDSDVADIMQCNHKQVKDVCEVTYLENQYLLLFVQENKKVPSYCYVFCTDNKDTFRKTLKELHDIYIQNKLEDHHNDKPQTDDADCIRFEVMLLGKINVKNAHPSTTFIDDSVKKIEHHHLLHHENHHHHHPPSVETLLPSLGSTEEITGMQTISATPSLQSVQENSPRQRCQSVSYSDPVSVPVRRRQRHSSEPSVPENFTHRSKIRLLLIGKSSLKLLCPVNAYKTIEIKFANISKCMQGCHLKDHFGFIANDVRPNLNGGKTKSQSEEKDVVRRICYVFKCAEEYICEEIMQGLKQAFLTCENEVSPMNEYHLLCNAIQNRQNVADKIALANNVVQSLNDNERECVYAQLNEMQPKTDDDKLGSVMITLRHSYEVRHVQHKSQIRANSMNALSQYESPLFFSKKIVNLKSKAKTSFESFWQKGRKKMMELQNDAGHFTDNFGESAGHKFGVVKTNSFSHSAPVTPQKDVEKKFHRFHTNGDTEPESNEEKESFMIKEMPYFHKIYAAVNSNATEETIDTTFETCRKIKSDLTPDQIRVMWKWAVTQQILVNKIRKIELKQAVPLLLDAVSSKTKYQALVPVPDVMQGIWEEIINLPCEIDGDKKALNLQLLQTAITKGIDSSQRGRVWKFLEEQWLSRSKNPRNMPVTPIGYAKLLQNLTSCQHSILIDIGRTFPNHPFYSQSLGAGQLALFNLLKAYSLTDEEVGYCQGLSFVAGVLLMHTCVEWEAFELLCHLMYQVGCRSMYMPDMKGIRLAVYKLSRLLYDMQNDLYLFLESHDVSILLISTPWFLTMFASTFSISFVARVFDMVFVSGTEALFRVALCTLARHKKGIMACRDFEEIVSYIRTTIPSMPTEDMASIIQEALQIDVTEKLKGYAIEYRLLFREHSIYMELNKQHENLTEELEMIKQVNKTVTESNCDLMQQLQAAHHKNAMLQKQLSNLNSQR